MKNETSQALSGEAGLGIIPILRRRLGGLLASAALAAVAAAGYFFLVAPKYESRAEVLLMQNDSGALASGVDGTGSVRLSEELLATHMKIIQSRRLISDALSQNGLDALPSIVERIGEDKSVSEYVRSNLFVTTGGQGAARDAHVINIAFRHTDAEDCKLVASAVLNQYQAFVKTKFQNVNEKAIGLIDDARKELEEEIKELDQEYASFRVDAPLLLGTDGGTDLHTQRYEELAVEASALTLQIEESSGRLSLVRESLAGFEGRSEASGLEKLSLIDEKNASRLGILVSVERGEATTAAFQANQPERVAGANAEYSSLLEMKTRLKQVMSEVGAQHPEVLKLQDQISEVETFIRQRSELLGVNEENIELTPDDIMGAYVSMLENDLNALLRRRDDIEKQMQVAEVEAKKLIELSIEQEDIIRDRDRRENLYSSVVDRLRSLNMQQDSTAIIHEIIGDPDVGVKVQPSLPIALAVFLLTGLVLGGGSTLLAEFRDRSVHTPEELESIFNAKVINHLPSFEKETCVREAAKALRKQKSKIDPMLIAMHSRTSPLSEVFRAMRTQVMFLLGGKNKIVTMTSATEGAGKSTTISNLAVSMALAGQRVLLVDCDLRRPRIREIFALEGKAGLAEVLLGQVEIEDAIDSQSTGLFVLSSGAKVDDPAELLSGEAFGNFLESVREKFDYVLLDSPPLLPVADPSIIAPLTDGVVIVSTIGHESKPESQRASRILTGVGAKSIGIVVNRADEASARYGYSSYGYESNSSKQTSYYTAKPPKSSPLV